MTPLQQYTEGYLASLASFNEYHTNSQQNFQQPKEENDLEAFEKLFNKLMKENKIDKEYLASKLGISANHSVFTENNNNNNKHSHSRQSNYLNN